MKTENVQIKGKVIMKSPTPTNCLAIMAILAEMARCINHNIAKVQLRPIDASFAIDEVAGARLEHVGTIKH